MDQPEPLVEDLGVGPPCGARSWNSTTRSVSAIAPADQARPPAAGAAHVEQVQHAEQHPDVAAGDDRPPAACSRTARDLLAVLGDHRPLLRPPGP